MLTDGKKDFNVALSHERLLGIINPGLPVKGRDLHNSCEDSSQAWSRPFVSLMPMRMHTSNIRRLVHRRTW